MGKLTRFHTKKNHFQEHNDKYRMTLTYVINKRFNCSFSPLTFSKLRFWPPKKKTTKQPPKFCNCSSFGPQGKKKKKKTRGTSLRVPRQRRPSQYQPWGPKLPQVQILGGCFVVFFLRGSKSQL